MNFIENVQKIQNSRNIINVSKYVKKAKCDSEKNLKSTQDLSFVLLVLKLCCP